MLAKHAAGLLINHPGRVAKWSSAGRRPVSLADDSPPEGLILVDCHRLAGASCKLFGERPRDVVALDAVEVAGDRADAELLPVGDLRKHAHGFDLDRLAQETITTAAIDCDGEISRVETLKSISCIGRSSGPVGGAASVTVSTDCGPVRPDLILAIFGVVRAPRSHGAAGDRSGLGDPATPADGRTDRCPRCDGEAACEFASPGTTQAGCQRLVRRLPATRFDCGGSG